VSGRKLSEFTGVVSSSGRRQLLNRGKVTVTRPSQIRELARQEVRASAAREGRSISTVGLKSSQTPLATPTGRKKSNLDRILKKSEKEAAKRLKQRAKEIRKDKELRKLARAAKKAEEKGKVKEKKLVKGYTWEEILGTAEPRKTSKGDTRKPLAEDTLVFRGDKVVPFGNERVMMRHQAGFKVTKDPNHEYSVNHNGERLVLNSHKGVIKFNGETVKGMPDFRPMNRQLPDAVLVRTLRDNMRYLENAEKNNITAPSIPWFERFGKVNPEYLAKEKGKPSYKTMELHHKDQWYKNVGVAERLERGEISIDEAKRLGGENLREAPWHSKGYEIAVSPKGSREYVILPGGAHNFTSPLYDANHPKTIHPKTGQAFEFGIPDKDKGSPYGETEGRQYHKNYTNQFWKEVRRQHVAQVAGEINRRVKAGDLTVDQVRAYWKESIAKQADA
jgi:hypothetical protein